MGSAKITYDPEMRQTDHGRRIYGYWKRIRKHEVAPEFVEYPSFFKWAMANGYRIGAKLLRYDEDKPFGPDNCYWLSHEECVGMKQSKAPTINRNLAWERHWDETVNRIRRHYGMKEIHSSEV